MLYTNYTITQNLIGLSAKALLTIDYEGTRYNLISIYEVPNIYFILSYY